MTATEESEKLAGLSAQQAGQALASGDLTAERYAAALLRRCEAGRALNAFITLEPERVLEAARRCDLRRRGGKTPGALHGLPVAIKDSINTRDYPTTAGTAALRHFTPAQDAAVVGTLTGAGAIVLGKTTASGVAAIVFPATRIGAPLIGEDAWQIGGKRVGLAGALARNIAPGSTAGLPGLVSAAGRTREGLPVALEFDSPAGADRVLLSIGLALEGALGRLLAPAVGAQPPVTG